jgi:hypothetical protein
MRIRVDWKKQLAGFLLMLIFISFTISGLMLINLTFTIAPFTLFGQPTQIPVNVIGAVFLLLAIIALVFMMRRKP